MTTIGQMDQRIELQALTNTAMSTTGQPVDVFTKIATVWAAAAHVPSEKAAEFFATRKINVARLVRFHLRYRSDVQPTGRVLWRGTFWNIHDVRPVDSQRIELELVCSEVA